MVTGGLKGWEAAGRPRQDPPGHVEESHRRLVLGEAVTGLFLQNLTKEASLCVTGQSWNGVYFGFQN